ncbi:hypothetical protein ACN4EK_32545 [Pantanalinema rosaneae CENA516]|uniref:hypothetical protein n=1 Tax=Pantanalinema rosaneae TaxID=1620701 RepID=UPI003D6DB017
MSFEHKAFLFDYGSFQSELEPVLVDALAFGNLAGLISFIESNSGILRDPYEGSPLDESWRGLMEEEDAHQFGDFALTKFYDPRDDIGLGSSWEQVQSALDEEFGRGSITVLGHAIGPDGAFFDPGKMGSYFLSEEAAREACRKLRGLQAEERTEAINRFLEILERSVAQGKGLYVTF